MQFLEEFEYIHKLVHSDAIIELKSSDGERNQWKRYNIKLSKLSNTLLMRYLANTNTTEYSKGISLQ